MVPQSRVKFTHTHFSASSKMTSSTKINVMSKRLKIAKFRLQILVDNSKSYSKRTYFFKIEEKMTELWCSKVGSNLNSKIVSTYGLMDGLTYVANLCRFCRTFPPNRAAAQK